MNPDDELAMRFVEINHDRYKNYFNQFIALHIGLFVAFYQMGEAHNEMIKDLQRFVPVAGFALAVLWGRVQYLLRKDIGEVWKIINARAKQEGLAENLFGIAHNRPRRKSSSWTMNWVPIFIAVVYLVLGWKLFVACS